MKTVLIILDGLSEEKVDELGNMTPLEYANTPILNEIIKRGRHSQRIFYPSGRKPDSLNCILSILGVDEKLIPQNRAYLEAVAHGINIENDEVVLRCNLISINDGKIDSFNGKGLTNSKMKEAAITVKTSERIKFYHISGYRNLIIAKKSKEILSLKNLPPHENLGIKAEELINNIGELKILHEFTLDNKFTLNNNDYMFYPWGVSEPSKLPSFYELHKKTCSCVCSAEIVKGIARAMKINLANLEKATGDIDTDLYEKASAVLSEINTHDVVIAHINGTDEVSHRKDLKGKITFIEKIDSEFLREIYNKKTDTKIIIVSDHQTSSRTGKHEDGYVDLIEYNMI